MHIINDIVTSYHRCYNPSMKVKLHDARSKGNPTKGRFEGTKKSYRKARLKILSNHYVTRRQQINITNKVTLKLKLETFSHK